MNKEMHLGYDAPYFDDEEREIIEAVQRGEYVQSQSRKEALRFWQAAVRNTLRQRPIAAGASEQDIERINTKAPKEEI